MPELYLPYNGKVKLESKYGYRTLNGVYGWHAGVDLVGIDSKTILAPCDGKIVSSLIITDKNNKTWEWGNYVRLDRADGLKIFMCHMSKRLVTAGQTVKRGDPIGIEGNTGYSFGSHCHFEVRKGSSSVDPTPYLGIKNEAGTYKNEEMTIDVSKTDNTTKNACKGIDVSHKNGAINWKKVKDAGITFAMLRMGYGTVTDGKFIENYKGAKEAGIVLGGYWFSYALNTSGAIAEADACSKLLQTYPLDLPVYYDFEDDTERYAKQCGVLYTNGLRTSIIQAFCSRLRSKNHKVGIYSNENYIAYLTNWSALSVWPLWLAKWPNYSGAHATGFSVLPGSVTTKWGSPQAWQFTDSGKVNGINGKVDLDWWYGTLPKAAEVSRPDSYTKNGLTFRRCKTFRIVYHDSKKVGANYMNYINGGFFGNFKASNGVVYTLPVANLVCDPWNVPVEGQGDILKHIRNGRLYWNCVNNHSDQFKGKKVSTLIVPVSGKPYVADVSDAPADCLYAISGVPTVRNGDDVDYYNYVKPQGWDDSCMGAAWRNWLGVRNGEIWVIHGKTTAKNYIYGMEFWNKVKDEGFDDIICLDGGGSEIFKCDGKTQKTLENRRINNLVVFE